MHYRVQSCLVVVAASLLAGCSRSDPPAPSSHPGDALHADGLHNLRRVSDKLLTGSSPEGDAGFRSLRDLGVRTVVSVDGARPDVERARAAGLRYVHLPFGYDGIPRQRVLELARAVRDLPGLVYLHCHHGKHRAPAAGAAVNLCLDSTCTVDRAVASMKEAGTDPRYVGLYDVARTLDRPSEAELSAASAEFPEVAEPRGMARSMVAIDATWERLEAIRQAGWKAPADHADLDPPHEALQLVEHYREAARLNDRRPEEFRRWLADAEGHATDLERALRARTTESDAAERAFQRSHAACKQCHAAFRDVPRSK